MTQAKDTKLAAQTPAPQARMGNGKALKHQVYSQSKNVLRRRSRRVAYRVRRPREVYPWLAHEKNTPTLHTWATIVVLLDDMGAALVHLGAWSREDGEDLVPRRLLNEFSRLAAQKTQLEDRLGINYAARRSFALDGLDGIGDLASQMQTAKRERGVG